MGDEVKSGPDSIETLNTKEKGGFRAASFVYALIALDNMGFVANMVSLVMYFYGPLHFDVSSSANTLTNLMGSTFLLSIVGGFISDTYIDRFKTCMIFGAVELAALVLMTIQARYPSLQTNAGGKSSYIHGGIAVMLYASLSLLAVGSGGVRGALPALGADQFNQKDPKEAKALGRYFNWLLLVTTWGAVIGVTVIVWVSTNKGWWKGFLICLVGTVVGFACLAAGKPFYRLQVPGDSPIIRIVQVIVVAIKNRKLPPPTSSEELYELNEKESVSLAEKIPHTEQFRCLDKAAVLGNNNEPTPWTACTVTQVEEVKILTRMLPIIASTIIMNTCLAQLQTYSVQQGYRMNRNIGSFEVPAPSVTVIPLIFMSILIPIYEYVFVPFVRKITNHPSGITQLQRVGVGLVLSIISMAVAALVEVKRRDASLKNPLKPISVFWLSLQYGIFGIADMFTLVGLLEFFYKEAPACMKSLSTSFTWLSLSFGYFLSSIFVDIINSVTRRTKHNHQGWLVGQDLDKYNLDLFYWFLAILSSLNFFNYLYWATWYQYKNSPEDDQAPETATTAGVSATENNENAKKATEDKVPKTTENGVFSSATENIEQETTKAPETTIDGVSTKEKTEWEE